MHKLRERDSESACEPKARKTRIKGQAPSKLQGQAQKHPTNPAERVILRSVLRLIYYSWHHPVWARIIILPLSISLSAKLDVLSTLIVQVGGIPVP